MPKTPSDGEKFLWPVFNSPLLRSLPALVGEPSFEKGSYTYIDDDEVKEAPG